MRPKLSFKNPKNITYICIASVIAILCTFLLDIFALNYWLRSAIKATVFLSCFLFFCKPHPKTVLQPKAHKSVLIALILGAAVIAVIWGGYTIINYYFDLSGTINIYLTKEEYWYATAYIAIVNSFLEELLFRGMCCIKLTENSNKIFANAFSASLFAIYHFTMLSNMMNVGLMILSLMSLFVAGLIFNKVNEKTENIYNSWFIHACANIAINTIGWTLL